MTTIIYSMKPCPYCGIKIRDYAICCYEGECLKKFAEERVKKLFEKIDLEIEEN